MLTVPVQKDIGEYKAKLAGLTFRTLGFTGAGLAACALTVLACHALGGISYSDAASSALVVIIPFFLAGYCKPCGLPIEKAWRYLARQYLPPAEPLTYRSSLSHAAAAEADGTEHDRRRDAVRRIRKQEREDYLDELDRARKAGPVECIVCRYHGTVR